ncbi:MAG: putative Ig domain-containing protein, partial [Pontiellaceae bacterium]|nr:putative Ig domain-containing protein [Pontiellaceae bacterium]
NLHGGSFVSGTVSSGTLNWLAGQLNPGVTLTVATNGVLNIGNTINLYGALVNEGTVTWTNGTITVYNHELSGYTGVISNRTGALWDIQCDGYSINWWQGFEQFVNEGTLRKSAGTGISYFYLNVLNPGMVDAQSGRIQMTYPITLTGGLLNSTLRGYGEYGSCYLGANPLDGRAGATLAEGFRPQTGDRFDLVRYDSLSGDFTGLELPSSAAWQTNYSANMFSITALNNAPETDPVTNQVIDELVPFSLGISAHDWDLEYPRIVGVSIPTNSMDAGCYPLYDSVWDVHAPAYPLSTTNGIGYLVSDQSISSFTLHDHVYVDSYVPDPARAVVTYELDQSATVSGVDIVQHGNGITEIEGFAGDSLTNMTSVGSVYSPAGQTTFAEGETSRFTFTAPISGRCFKFIIRHTSVADGYAAYRAFLLNSEGDRIRPAFSERNELAYSLIGAPSGASINPTNGLFTWTPSESQGPSSNIIQVVVRDNGSPELFATNTFSIVVNEINVAPVLGTIGNKNVNEGVALSFTAAATDSDIPTNTLVYSLVGAPAGASINTNSGVFNWTPTEAQGASNYTFTVRVTDNNPAAVNSQNLTDEEIITVTVNEINVAPVLGAIGNKNVNEGSALTFTATATDADLPVNTLAYSLVGAPSGASIGTNSGVFNWTPAEAQGPGEYTFTVRVTDSNPTATNTQNLTDEESITVTVNEVNVAPVLGAISSKNVNEGSNLTFTVTATDADLPANTLTYSLVGAPTGASIGGSSGVFSWTPTETQGPSTNTITVRVQDNGTPSLAVTNSFTVTVNEVNVAPVLTVPTNQTLNELATLTVTNTATDADLPANTLRFELLANPSGMTLNTNTGVIVWTPTEAQGPSTNTVTVRVYDNGTPSLAVTNSFTVTVNEVNVAPVLTVPTNQTLNELATLTVTNTATDTDLPANTLRFELLANPSGMTLNTNTGVIVWTPTEAQGPSTNTVTVRVYDNGTPSLAVTNSFTVTVNEVNVAPVLTVPTNRTINELTTLTVTNTATDADLPANTLRFELLANPGGMTINTNTGVIVWTPTEAQGPSTNTVTVRVYDNGTPSLAATNSFTVTVNEVNVAPVLTVPADQNVHALEPIALQATATDSDMPTNSLTIELVSGPAGLAVSPSGQISWTPSSMNAGSVYEVQVRAKDNGSPMLTDQKSFFIHVMAVCEIQSDPNPIVNGGFKLTWNSISGRVYQVQSTTNLISGAWQNHLAPLTATGSQTSVTNVIDTQSKFYRIQLIQ